MMYIWHNIIQQNFNTIYKDAYEWNYIKNMAMSM